jgi:tetratricopeptide (TPR) repeat protein
MRYSPAFVFLTALFVSTSAAAQYSEPRAEHRESQCARGIIEACSFWEFGLCAHDDPRVAIPECSRMAGGGGLRGAKLYVLRANAYARSGDLNRALTDYDRATTKYGAVYWIHAFRAGAYYYFGDYEAALSSYNEALSLEPNRPSILNERAWMLATAPDDNVRDGLQAITDALAAIELAPRSPAIIDTLAAAYAENGEFENAVEAQQRAIDVLQAGDKESIADYQSRLDLYSQGMPYRHMSKVE